MPIEHISRAIRDVERELAYDKLAHRKYAKYWFINRKPATVAQVERWLNRLKKLGYEVIPVCANINSKGECLGHPTVEDSERSEELLKRNYWKILKSKSLMLRKNKGGA